MVPGSEVANCDALVAVGDLPHLVGSVARRARGTRSRSMRDYENYQKRNRRGPTRRWLEHFRRHATDRYREKPEREDDDPERLLALETLTLSARAGVAAAAAALGQLHYHDAPRRAGGL